MTPRVAAEARTFFDCPTLPGAELENQDTSAGQCYASHWEERLFKTEMMSALTSRVTFVSRVTLAYFEDTGWYRADYTHAQTPSWGYHAGCAFALRPCLSGPKSNPTPSEARHFCTATLPLKVPVPASERRCSVSRLFQGSCSLGRWPSELPVWNR